MRVLGFPDYADQAGRLAQALGIGCDIAELHHFPDGESLVCLPTALPRKLILCRSLDRPNDKLIELQLACAAARERGVEHLCLIAPYLCYMRQDTAFHPGEINSQRVVGRWLAGLVDELITVDPHLHRVRTLREAVPSARAIAVSAAPLFAELLRARTDRPLLLGPDIESEQWVRAIAEGAGLDHVVGRKERRGDRAVTIALPDYDYRQPIVIVDDVISTGHTVIEAARELRSRGAGTVDCLVTHALFTPGTTERLREAGMRDIRSTDSISHATNAIPLAELLASAINVKG